MRVLLILLFIVIAAVVLVTSFQHHSGYVIIHLAQTQVELSFWTAILTLLVAFILLYIVVRLLARLLGLGTYLRKRKKIKLAQNIKKLTENGLLDALNGRWPSANSSLEKAATLSRNKLIPKLFCALGALLEGNATNRDLALSTVDIRNKQEQTSFQLAKAQILMASQDWEKAFSCLKIQYEKTPSHPYAIFLLAQTCCQLQEWALLSQLLPNLKRNKAVKETQYKRWQEECFHYRLKLASRQSTNELMDTWKRADRDEKSRLLVKKTYIEGLIGLNEFEKAKSELAYLLKKQWDALLCYCYLKFPADQIDGLLTAVDSLCQEHPHEIICQKTLGILCYQSRRYVRAKEILSSAVLQHPCRESLEFLAYAHAAEGEWEQSIVFLKQALSL